MTLICQINPGLAPLGGLVDKYALTRAENMPRPAEKPKLLWNHVFTLPCELVDANAGIRYVRKAEFYQDCTDVCMLELDRLLGSIIQQRQEFSATSCLVVGST